MEQNRGKTDLGDFAVHALSVGKYDLDEDVVVGIVGRLSVAPGVLAREKPADDEHKHRAHRVADGDDDPGDVVAATLVSDTVLSGIEGRGRTEGGTLPAT